MLFLLSTLKKMQSERTEIVDFSGEKLSSFTIPRWALTAILPLIVILDVIFFIINPESPYTMLVSIVLISIFIFYCYSVVTKSPGKLRKFSISYENIEVTLPDTPLFIVNWSEFEKIEITLKILELKPFYVYRYQFIGQNSEKQVTISLLDFHKEKIDEILKALRKYAVMLGKKFSVVKETNVSGVNFIEDFP